MGKLLRVTVMSFLAVAFMSSLALAEISFKPGADIRIRHEFWKNLFDQENTTKDNRNFFRFRYRIFGDLKLDENTSFYVRLTDEFKSYSDFYYADAQRDTTFNLDETVIDNLYLDVKNVLDFPVDIRLGRQDFLGTYGEGFLIMDGTPMDGSRTTYFNAAKVSYRPNETNTVDFIYMNNPRTDEMLPIINDLKGDQLLNRTAETGYVLYWKNKDIENLSLEPYYIYKTEDDDYGRGLQSKNSHIHTFGSFGKYQKDTWTFRGQLAGQLGDYGASSRQGLGGYVFVDKTLDYKFSPKLTGGFMYLSGDDPNTTDKNEGWDPLFSRWPWMSELYVISYNGESDMGYWTNLMMYNLQAQCTPTEKSKVTLAYNFLQAVDNPGAALSGGPDFSDGKNRGHLPQFRIDYKINKNVSTYFLAEYFIPGNYYADTADESLFLRTEVLFKF